MVEIYKLTDNRTGNDYYCKSKAAMQSVIAKLTDLPRNSNAVKDIVAGNSDDFSITTYPFYTNA